MPPLVVVAVHHAGSGGGWTHRACASCLARERLIPLAFHPLRHDGSRLTYPEIVPGELVATLAPLGESPALAAPVTRLLAAVARTKDRTLDADQRHAAHDAARATVAHLRKAARQESSTVRQPRSNGAIERDRPAAPGRAATPPPLTPPPRLGARRPLAIPLLAPVPPARRAPAEATCGDARDGCATRRGHPGIHPHRGRTHHRRTPLQGHHPHPRPRRDQTRAHLRPPVRHAPPHHPHHLARRPTRLTAPLLLGNSPPPTPAHPGGDHRPDRHRLRPRHRHHPGGDRTMNPTGMVAIEITAATVRLGDQLVVGGRPYTVTDMNALASGGKLLHFHGGESFHMGRFTVLWASRHISQLPGFLPPRPRRYAATRHQRTTR
ncbi:hypothetical protein DEH69_25335 [Streptomyces sp. PT12]|nr:hypothetical protein DEH69_25335 [Streptomyces sp. PT12]